MLALSSREDLENLFPEAERAAIFRAALTQALASEKLGASAKSLDTLQDPPDLELAAEAREEEAWTRISGDVEKHLQYLRSRERTLDELRLSGFEYQSDAELEAAYVQVSRQLERAQARVDLIKDKRAYLEVAKSIDLYLHDLIKVKLHFAEGAKDLEDVEWAEERAREKAALPLPDRLSLHNTDRLSELKAKISSLKSREQQLSTRKLRISEAEERNSEENRSANSALRQISEAARRLQLQREQQMERQIQGLLELDPRMRELSERITNSVEHLQSVLVRRAILPILTQTINKAIGKFYLTWLI
jgi:hypothetical protein